MFSGEDYFHGTQEDGRGPDDLVWPERTAVDVNAAVMHAYSRVDNLHGDVQEEGGSEELHGEEDEELNVFGADYKELVRESTEAVYEGSKVN